MHSWLLKLLKKKKKKLVMSQTFHTDNTVELGPFKCFTSKKVHSNNLFR